MNEKRIAILQSNYISWKGYFDIINMVDEFIIYDCVQYTKNDWRNRNQIKTARGLQWLTIPCFINSLHQSIRDTKIANPNWNRKHWETLKTEYGKSECFNEYNQMFEGIYLKELAQFTYLHDINIYLIDAVCCFLGIKTKIRDSKEFIISGDKTERLINIIKQCNGTIYLSGNAAKDYLNVELMNQNGITVEWMNYDKYKSDSYEYRQLHKPFIHNVSVLDLLFNVGDNSRYYLDSYFKHSNTIC